MLSINYVALLAGDTKTHISHPFHLLGFITFITESHWPDLYLVLTTDFILISAFMYA